MKRNIYDGNTLKEHIGTVIYSNRKKRCDKCICTTVEIDLTEIELLSILNIPISDYIASNELSASLYAKLRTCSNCRDIVNEKADIYDIFDFASFYNVELGCPIKSEEKKVMIPCEKPDKFYVNGMGEDKLSDKTRNLYIKLFNEIQCKGPSDNP